MTNHHIQSHGAERAAVTDDPPTYYIDPTLPVHAYADAADGIYVRPRIADPVADWLAEPSTEPCDTVRAYLLERCADVLPAVDPADAMPYLVALHRHLSTMDDTTRADLLGAMVAPDRIDAASIRRDVLASPAPFSFLGAASAQTAAPTAPASFVRANGTVRGHAYRTVIGDDDDRGYRRAPVDELRERADLWLHAAGTPLPMIGTDDYSWEQVVTHRPDVLTWTTDDGETARAVIRPAGAGRSIVGRDSSRKRSRHRDRRATYSRRPVDRTIVVDTRGVATLTTRYRTSMVVGETIADHAPIIVRGVGVVRQAGNYPRDVAHETRYRVIERRTAPRVILSRDRVTFIGNGRAVHAVTTTREGRARRGVVTRGAATATAATLGEIGTLCRAAWCDDTAPRRVVYRDDATRVAVTLRRERRVWSVSVTRHGTTRRGNVRSLEAVLKRID